MNFKLLEAGIFLHLSGNKRIIIRTRNEVNNGSILYDDKGMKFGKVVELFGPVKEPYISAIPLTNNLPKSAGKKIYIKN